jgi:hypothetical protein
MGQHLQIPYPMKQEIISTEQGILAQASSRPFDLNAAAKMVSTKHSSASLYPFLPRRLSASTDAVFCI